MSDCSQLAAIRERVERGPTVLRADEEVAVFLDLQAVPYETVVRCHEDFDEITSALYASHMDTYFEVDDSNIGPFRAFADWLDGLGEHVGGAAQESLRELAEHFRANSKHFKL
jgi:hypothetical protein